MSVPMLTVSITPPLPSSVTRPSTNDPCQCTGGWRELNHLSKLKPLALQYFYRGIAYDLSLCGLTSAFERTQSLKNMPSFLFIIPPSGQNSQLGPLSAWFTTLPLSPHGWHLEDMVKVVSSSVNVFLSSGGDPPPSEGLLEPVVKFLTLISGSQLWLPSARGSRVNSPQQKKNISQRAKLIWHGAGMWLIRGVRGKKKGAKESYFFSLNRWHDSSAATRVVKDMWWVQKNKQHS